MPIYDNPNHPHYGPVRRLHVMLMQLFANFDDAQLAFHDVWGRWWDDALVDFINEGRTEGDAQCRVLAIFLEHSLD